MRYAYKVKLLVTDVEGCDELEVEIKIINAHSFSEALVLAERTLIYKQGILRVLDIRRVSK